MQQEHKTWRQVDPLERERKLDAEAERRRVREYKAAVKKGQLSLDFGKGRVMSDRRQRKGVY